MIACILIIFTCINYCKAKKSIRSFLITLFQGSFNDIIPCVAHKHVFQFEIYSNTLPNKLFNLNFLALL